MKKTLQVLLLVAVVGSLAGCRTAYYEAMEVFGREKRHLLRSEVEEAQEAQEEAGEQFQTTLERIKSMTNFDGGELEGLYKKLKSDYERSQARAESVHSQVKDVDTVARDLFREWEAELNQIQSAELRARSAEQLAATRGRYDRMYSAMKSAEARMDPVLSRLNDYVLYLKHNLNAQAIGSLRSEVSGIEDQVEVLVDDLQKSIREAEKFLETME